MRTNANTLRNAAFMAAIVVLGIGLWTAPLAAQSSGNQIAGLWQIQGSPDPNSGIDPFVNVATLTGDGQIINVDPNFGTGVGSWERISGQEYVVTFTGFIASDGTRYVVTAVLTLDMGAGTFAGPFHTEFLDPNSNVIFEFGGTVSLSRQ